MTLSFGRTRRYRKKHCHKRRHRRHHKRSAGYAVIPVTTSCGDTEKEKFVVKHLEKITKNHITHYFARVRVGGKQKLFILPKEYPLKFKSKSEAKHMCSIANASLGEEVKGVELKGILQDFIKAPCAQSTLSVRFGRKKMSAKSKKTIAKIRAFGRRRKATFGRRRKTSKRKSTSGLRRRRSSKVEFGKKRRHRRRHHKKHDEEMSFGRKRRSSKVQFGKKRRYRRHHHKKHDELAFGRRRKSSFGLSLSRPLSMNYGFSRFL